MDAPYVPPPICRIYPAIVLYINSFQNTTKSPLHSFEAGKTISGGIYISTYLFTLAGYTHFYRSLLRFCRISSHEAKELTYLLNTANMDSLKYTLPDFALSEASPFEFNRHMDDNKRPYRTEVQFYKSMEALNRNINREAITADQREALYKMRCIMRDIESAFYKSFGMDITDKRTVYAECVHHLVPRECEPSVCLMDEWIMLPSA